MLQLFAAFQEPKTFFVRSHSGRWIELKLDVKLGHERESQLEKSSLCSQGDFAVRPHKGLQPLGFFAQSTHVTLESPQTPRLIKFLLIRSVTPPRGT